MPKDVAALLTIKNKLKFKTRPNVGFNDIPQNLIGVNDHNVHPKPTNISFPYIVISTGNNYVFPSSYMLQGRKRYNANLLVSWTFEGLRNDGKWDLLHSCTGCTFKNSEIRNYTLETSRGYSAFNITMTDKDSGGREYALCLGQIEVYGIVVRMPNRATCNCKKARSSYVFIFILAFNTK